MKIFKYQSGIEQTKITLLGVKFCIKHNYEPKAFRNYGKVLSNLKTKFGKQKIKVGFLVNEAAKWQYQSVYEELAQSSDFEPVVLVTQLVMNHKGKHNFYQTINDCYDFFKSRGMNVRYAYNLKKKKYVAAKNLGVDILFYPQPWEIADVQHPYMVSRYALTCYVPYGLHLVDFEGSYMRAFHAYLWLMFVETPRQIEQFSQKMGKEVKNCTLAQYPKLDEYFKDTVTEYPEDKPIVIYAPHHSFEKDGLCCATFADNGLRILEIAQKSADKINWIFKPHPRFKTAVVNNKIMTPEQINAYYNEWNKLGQIVEGGNYINLFKQSSAMITDCISFLGEYLPSGHPLFHLLAKKRPFNDLAKSFLDAYYQIENINSLEKILNDVVIRHNDVLQEVRKAKMSILFDPHEKSATKIVNKLRQMLN